MELLFLEFDYFIGAELYDEEAIDKDCGAIDFCIIIGGGELLYNFLEKKLVTELTTFPKKFPDDLIYADLMAILGAH